MEYLRWSLGSVGGSLTRKMSNSNLPALQDPPALRTCFPKLKEHLGIWDLKKKQGGFVPKPNLQQKSLRKYMENRSALSFSCLIQVNGCLMDLFTVGDITKFNHEFGKFVFSFAIFTTGNHPFHFYVPGKSRKVPSS